MGSTILPVRLVADIEKLRQDIKNGAKAAPTVYLALAINDGRNTSLIIPLDYYLVKRNRAAAYKFVKEMWNFKTDPIPDDKRFAKFKEFRNSRWSTRSPEEWGLMLLLWHDVYWDELNPQASLFLELANWLGIKIGVSWTDPLDLDGPSFSKLIGTRVDIRKDPVWVAAMEYTQTVRLSNLEAAVEIGVPTFTRMGIVVLSAVNFSGLGWLAALALESTVNLLDFLFTEWEAERDGVITEEELKDVTWAGLGILGWTPLQLCLLGFRLGWAIGELLNSLAKGAIQLAEELPDRIAAAQASYDEYVTAKYATEDMADSVFVVLDEA
jgi:hypothetical protein